MMNQNFPLKTVLSGITLQMGMYTGLGIKDG